MYNIKKMNTNIYKKIKKNQNARVLFKTQRSFSVPTTKDPNNTAGINERQVYFHFYFMFRIT